MSRLAEKYLPFLRLQKGFYSNYPIIAPMRDTGGQVYNVKAPPYNAVGDGVTDDTAAIQAAMNDAGPLGATVLFPPATYLISSPLTWAPDTNSSTPKLAPSLQGAFGRGGPSQDMGIMGAVRLRCSSTFPIGSFLIDYIGPTHTDTSITGYKVAGFVLDCNNRGAGLRSFNSEDSLWCDIVITNNPRTPAPVNNAGVPTGAVSFVASPSPNSTFNYAERIYVSYAQKDAFDFNEGNGSWVVADKCSSYAAGRHGYVANDGTYISNCFAQASGQSDNTGVDWQVWNATLVGCSSFNANPLYNCIQIVGNNNRSARVVGCWFRGSNSSGHTELQNALIQIGSASSQAIHATFAGNTFMGQSQTSNFVHVRSGCTGSVVFTGSEFSQSTDLGAPITGPLYNFNGTNITRFVGCPGINPLGPQTSPAIPTSNVAFTNPFPVDMDVFITGGTVSAIAIGGTNTGLTSGAFRVPFGQNIKITYTVAPTWVWFGD